MEKVIEQLKKNNIEIVKNFDISNLSSIRIGGKLRFAIFPKTTKELIKVLSVLYASKVYFKVVGNLSNILFVSDISYPVVITNKMIDEVEIEGGKVEVSAGMLVSKFSDTLRKNRLSGFEGLVGIPATIGGAIMNNAGAFGYSVSDRLVKVKVFFAGRVFDIFKNQIKFSYHYSNLAGFVLISATFLFENKNEYDIINLTNEFTYLRGQSQPNGFSLGSVYKKINGKSAGFYIERAGLKGLRTGGAVVSIKHANFFINDKGASATDFLRLSAKVESAVLNQFGLTLLPEIEKVGDKDEIIGRFAYPFK